MKLFSVFLKLIHNIIKISYIPLISFENACFKIHVPIKME